MTMDQQRTGDIFKLRANTSSVMLIGCGALGSAVALMLAKLGIDLHLVDDDVIESHNIPNQLLYGINDVGKHKAEVLSNRLHELTGNRPRFTIGRAGDKTITDRNVFVCVDSMAARKKIAMVLSDVQGCIVEGRMGATEWSAYCVSRANMNDMREYYRSFYSDDEVVHDRAACGSIMSIGATAAMLASQMVWLYMDCVMERPYNNVVHSGVRAKVLNAFAWGNTSIPEYEDEEEI